jgi:putative flippase GtrA
MEDHTVIASAVDSHHSHVKDENHFKLALSATLHCLIGCGLGEVLGMILGTLFLMSNHATMVLAIILGFVGGFGLGVIPLRKAGYTWTSAFKQVLIAEGLSIAVMETFEVLVQVYTPGVMDAGLTDGIFWLGMLLGLIAGFIAAFPVNYVFVKKGIRHKH